MVVRAVANDQALEPWLDEALCTYSEKLYLETYAPQALDWWLQVRLLYYQPRGYVDDFDLQSAERSAALPRLP